MLLSDVQSSGTYEVSRKCELPTVQRSQYGQINSQVQLSPGDSIVVDSVKEGVLSVRILFAGATYCISREIRTSTNNNVGNAVEVKPRTTD